MAVLRIHIGHVILPGWTLKDRVFLLLNFSLRSFLVI